MNPYARKLISLFAVECKTENTSQPAEAEQVWEFSEANYQQLISLVQQTADLCADLCVPLLKDNNSARLVAAFEQIRNHLAITATPIDLEPNRRMVAVAL